MFCICSHPTNLGVRGSNPFGRAIFINSRNKLGVIGSELATRPRLWSRLCREIRRSGDMPNERTFDQYLTSILSIRYGSGSDPQIMAVLKCGIWRSEKAPSSLPYERSTRPRAASFDVQAHDLGKRSAPGRWLAGACIQAEDHGSAYAGRTALFENVAYMTSWAYSDRCTGAWSPIDLKVIRAVSSAVKRRRSPRQRA